LIFALAFGRTCDMDAAKARAFIDKHGSDMERYTAAFLFDGLRDDSIAIAYLDNLQNPDGGFPYNLTDGNPTSVNETCGFLSVFLDLGLKETKQCHAALHHLFMVQKPDGGWDENPEIADLEPPFWDEPGSIRTRVWLTGEIARQLIRLGHKGSESIQRAARFLRKHRGNDGRFAGFEIATWIALGVFGELHGPENEIVLDSLNLVSKWLREDEEDAAFLCWYLECLDSAGIPSVHPLVSRCANALQMRQHEDGTFSSADGARYTIKTTLSALKLLKALGRW
jgi:hypothetical protein